MVAACRQAAQVLGIYKYTPCALESVGCCLLSRLLVAFARAHVRRYYWQRRPDAVHADTRLQQPSLQNLSPCICEHQPVCGSKAVLCAGALRAVAAVAASFHQSASA
eukprot:364087-Chlamydomonas_euryale.AAC.8